MSPDAVFWSLALIALFIGVVALTVAAHLEHHANDDPWDEEETP